MSDKPTQDGFFDDPKVVSWILRIFYLLCVLLVVADFVVHRHIYTELEKIPAFYALYGFVACVLLVFAASGLRKVLMRSEDYYEAPLNDKSDRQEQE